MEGTARTLPGKESSLRRVPVKRLGTGQYILTHCFDFPEQEAVECGSSHLPKDESGWGLTRLLVNSSMTGDPDNADLLAPDPLLSLFSEDPFFSGLLGNDLCLLQSAEQVEKAVLRSLILPKPKLTALAHIGDHLNRSSEISIGVPSRSEHV